MTRGGGSTRVPPEPRRLFASAAVAALLAASLLGSLGAGTTLAADDGLALTSTAAYTLVPDKGLVHVTVDVTATNIKPNLVEQTPNGTLTTRYFYDEAGIVIHSEASAIRASAGKAKLGSRIEPQDGYTILRVSFPKDLNYKQSTKFRVDYDLTGGAPRSDSDIRVGTAFATFYVWAFGDSGEVRVTVPAGFEVQTSGSTIAKSVAAGVTTLTATSIGDTSSWFAVVVADRHDALTTDRLDLADGEHVVVRAWPEDAEWRTRVDDLLRTGLPVLVEKIGLDWPVKGDIEVAEVHTPLLEGYAGVFYTNEDRVEISEDLDELTIIHEASHAWFNSNLFVGRWINEGFADEYASRVLDEVSVGGLRPESVSPTSDVAVDLNAWTHPGRIDDEATSLREHYGYEASWTVVRTLVDEIGEESMQKVFAAADTDTTAYPGAGDPETVKVPNDWRRFLDLLEGAGGSTKADDLFRRWIISPDQEGLLDARSKARTAYGDLLDAGTGWQPGYVVRDPMGRWQFGPATTAMAEARAILAIRDQIAARAADLSIAPPGSLRAAYEAATHDLDKVRDLAAAQLGTASALDAARDRVVAERDPFAAIGLMGEDPAGSLTTASTAFSAGDTAAADAGAAAIERLMTSAADTGKTRALVAGLTGGGVLAAAGSGAVAMRRRRRPFIGPVMTWAPETTPVEPVEPVGVNPSATAADRADAAAQRTTALLAKFRPPRAEAEPARPPTDPGPNPTEPYATLGDPRPAQAAGDGPAEPGRAEGVDT